LLSLRSLNGIALGEQVACSSKLVMAEVEGSLSPDLHRSALERGRKPDKAEKAERKEKRRQRKAEREAAFAADAVSELKDDQRARREPDQVPRASPHHCCVAQDLIPSSTGCMRTIATFLAALTARNPPSLFVRLPYDGPVAVAGSGEEST